MRVCDAAVVVFDMVNVFVGVALCAVENYDAYSGVDVVFLCVFAMMLVIDWLSCRCVWVVVAAAAYNYVC